MAYTDIDDPSEYFNSLIYTGNVTVRALTFDGNSDLDVDWIWLKSRSASGNHHVYDTVRGTQKHLRTNLASAEGTNGGTDGVTAFSSNGVTIGTNTASNEDNTTFVGWGWKAGTSFSNDASSTSVGSLDSAGSVSTDAGFSIISYTGAGDGQASSTQTVAHGLGVVPQVLIVKNLADSTNWFVYHHKNTSAPATDVLYLNLNNATGDDNGPWNDVAPTSSVFTVGGDNGTNGNGDGMIAYCFAEKQGYSKFGSYTGNGNADGPFVYLGFKPSFVMIKVTSTTSNWGMFDNKRLGFNPKNEFVRANETNAESSDYDGIDFLSNGFKLRTTSTLVNAAQSYIYMAFAENPFVTSTGVPATAR
jgi:hypothetical protein